MRLGQLQDSNAAVGLQAGLNGLPLAAGGRRQQAQAAGRAASSSHHRGGINTVAASALDQITLLLQWRHAHVLHSRRTPPTSPHAGRAPLPARPRPALMMWSHSLSLSMREYRKMRASSCST